MFNATGKGGAAGFCLGNALLTDYHVAREEIEAARRTEGSLEPLRCRYLRAEGLDGLVLLANASQADWKAGRDWAKLRLPGASLRPLPLAGRAPEVGEPVWSFGFPMRTRRNSRTYPDADGSLRVAAGHVTKVEAGHFVADLDGVSGSSGGPVVDVSGAALGMIWNVEPAAEASRRPAAFAGGMIAVRVPV